MVGLLLLALASGILVTCDGASLPYPVRRSGYWQLRDELMRDEMQRSLGGELHLDPIEIKANEILMAAKNQEIHDGLILSSFPRSNVFLFVIDLCKFAIIYVRMYERK